MAGIWVFAENQDLTRELLSVGKDLAAKLGEKLAAFATGADPAKNTSTVAPMRPFCFPARIRPAV